ncbi:MAG TPA: hypothetical protein VFW44_19440 [Bryobacteraceae bacterium]|nr:hypothetical protein [Bryobacteraceae bacterium]
MRCCRILLLAAAQLALVADSQIPPAIDPGSVVNAASRMPASLPAGALAPGARFTLTGVRLGPEHPERGNEKDPPAMLSGVSIHVVQGKIDVAVGVLFASARRIDGIIPASAPLGPVQLVASYNGVASEPYALNLVDSNLAFFTPDTAPDELRQAAAPSTSPGQMVAVWGTGLGASRPELFLGGKRLTSRAALDEACCAGVTRFDLRIPDDAPLGCYVPLQARDSGRPTNVIGIDIHRPNEKCSEPFEWLGQGTQKGANSGFVLLARVSMAAEGEWKLPSYEFDYAAAAFGKQNGQPLFPPLPAFGTCRVHSGRFSIRRLLSDVRAPGTWAEAQPSAPRIPIDAGPGMTLSGHGAEQVLRPGRGERGAFSSIVGGETPLAQVPKRPLFFSPGEYRVASTGGADVGAFVVNVDAQRPIDWTNRASLSEVSRAKGITLEWKEARRDDAVLIAAISSDEVTGASSMCICLANAKDRRFAIPALVLANLPPSAADNLEPSVLLIAELPLRAPASIHAPGLDSGFASFVSVSGRMVRFR